jgi:hypothetical protein
LSNLRTEPILEELTPDLSQFNLRETERLELQASIIPYFYIIPHPSFLPFFNPKKYSFCISWRRRRRRIFFYSFTPYSPDLDSNPEL